MPALSAILRAVETLNTLLEGLTFWHWGVFGAALLVLETLLPGGLFLGAGMAAFLVAAGMLAAPYAPMEGVALTWQVQTGAWAALTLALSAVARAFWRRRPALDQAPPCASAPPQRTPRPAATPTPAPEPAADADKLVLRPDLMGEPEMPTSPVPKPTLTPAPVAAAIASVKPASPPVARAPKRAVAPRPAAAVAQRPAPPPPAPNPKTAPPAQVEKKPVVSAKMGARGAARPKAAAGNLVGREFTLWKPVDGGVGVLKIQGDEWRIAGPDLPGRQPCARHRRQRGHPEGRIGALKRRAGFPSQFAAAAGGAGRSENAAGEGVARGGEEEGARLNARAAGGT